MPSEQMIALGVICNIRRFKGEAISALSGIRSPAALHSLTDDGWSENHCAFLLHVLLPRVDRCAWQSNSKRGPT